MGCTAHPRRAAQVELRCRPVDRRQVHDTPTRAGIAGWKTFLHNHFPDIGAIDLFVVPTIGFKLLYGLVIITLQRRRLVWINVTANPTADWIARQITEALPWEQAPRYLIRDRDASYGHA